MRDKRLNTSLLLGNGPNRITAGHISWEQVLKQLAAYTRDREVLKYSAEKPFPLLYEELAIRCIRRGKLESDLKKRVANLMKEMVPTGLHQRIVACGFRHIITTNYDYCLEIASGAAAEPTNLREEKRYSLFRRRRLGNTYVWHIHGEIDRPRTITLGHDHYVGYLGRIKDYVVWDRKTNDPKSDAKHSVFIQRKKEFEDEKTLPYSWVDVFLRDDIHILGFTLDYSEIHLWWLLIFKERLRLKAAKYSSVPRVGSTTFYNICEEPIPDSVRGKLSLLESIGVQTENVDCDRGYEHAYHTVLGRILEHA